MNLIKSFSKMPSSYYCADNFFKKMTDLDSPRRNNDCYFYYYSTCAKGDSCTFRHEPSALGCETMCSFWKEGKCLNVHCNFRHMELRKNRKAIQCYWETQPGGCLKPHCPFLHQDVKPNTYTDNKIGSNSEPTQTIKSDIGQASEKSFKNPVDSLVVNFEEESDTESATSLSPIKSLHKRVKVKTLEEIKLEKIQEESAAYFSYEGDDHSSTTAMEDDLRSRLLHKMRQKRLTQEEGTAEAPIKKIKLTLSEDVSLDDRIKILTEEVVENPENISLDDHIQQKRKKKVVPVSKKKEKQNDSFKIKTLAEIRAERLKKQEENELDSQIMKSRKRLCESENEVSSTSRDETEILTSPKEQPRKKLRLKRLSSEKEDTNQVCDVEPLIPKEESNLKSEYESNEVKKNEESDFSNSINNEVLDSEKTVAKYDNNCENSLGANSDCQAETNSNGSDRFPNKLAEEVLLLDDDDDYTDVTLKAEDELLGEIDDILGS